MVAICAECLSFQVDLGDTPNVYLLDLTIPNIENLRHTFFRTLPGPTSSCV